MRVIPVIDLLNGVVVRGVAGRRAEYRPIQSRIAADAQPATVARAFADEFAFQTVYVADLDAIQFRRPNLAAWQGIAGAGLKLWLDAGVDTVATARSLSAHLADRNVEARLVVGSESLRSEDDLRGILEVCAETPPVFSLDLQAGRPLVGNHEWQSLSPLELARLALYRGWRQMIVLDLADVGVQAGTRTLELCRQIKSLEEPVEVIAGGGVRGPADLEALAAAGCSAALVASALHDGRLTPAGLRLFSSPLS